MKWRKRVGRLLGGKFTAPDLEPDYVVLRGVDIPPDMDGLWIDRNQLTLCSAELALNLDTMVSMSATGTFELREDGAVAEVFEVSHGDANE